jgi:hypothetical protein
LLTPAHFCFAREAVGGNPKKGLPAFAACATKFQPKSFCFDFGAKFTFGEPACFPPPLSLRFGKIEST